jgi:hypothetical protein
MKPGPRLQIILALAFALAACAPVADVGPGSASFETMVAATVRALPTQTAIVTPSPTLRLTSTRATPTEWPSATPFSTFTLMPTTSPLPTFTPVRTYRPVRVTPGPRQGDVYYACTQIGQVPANNFVAAPGQVFTVSWTVQNVGLYDWDVNSIDVAYRSGEFLAVDDRFDIPISVPAGASFNVQISMTAPTKKGEYSTRWSLARNEEYFCKLTFRFVVK